MFSISFNCLIHFKISTGIISCLINISLGAIVNTISTEIIPTSAILKFIFGTGLHRSFFDKLWKSDSMKCFHSSMKRHICNLFSINSCHFFFFFFILLFLKNMFFENKNYLISEGLISGSLLTAGAGGVIVLVCLLLDPPILANLAIIQKP